MASALLQVEQLSIRLGGKQILHNISFTIAEGEALAITGPTGSGKTTLLKALAAQVFSAGSIHFSDINGHRPKLVMISRQHHFTNLSNLSSFYYQQRFNSFDSEDARTAQQELRDAGASDEEIVEILKRFGILHIRDEPLIQLSNGEHKRFQIAKAILQHADWLLLDNPFTGLDVTARKILADCLDSLAKSGVHILLVTGPSDIPSVITHVCKLKDGKLEKYLSAEEYRRSHAAISYRKILDFEKLTAISPAYHYPDFEVAVKMVNTTVE